MRRDGHLTVDPDPDTSPRRRALVLDPPLVRRPSRLPVAEPDPLYQVGRRERNYRRALSVADMFAAALSVPLAITFVGGDGLRDWYLILIPLIVLTSKVLGLYDHDELVVRKSTIDEFPRLISLASTFTLLVWGTRHLTVLGAPGTSAMAALWATLAVSLTAFRSIARRVAAIASPVERCLVLGDGRAYDRLEGPLVDQRGVALVGRVPLERALRDALAVREMARAEHVHRIIIAPDGALRPEDTLELVRRAKETGLRVSLLPGILEAVGSSVVFDDIGGVTLLGVPRFGLTRSSRAVKRAFDVATAAVLLLVGLPIMAVAALVIRLDSRGPAFFRQTRVGREGEHFSMIKLRTMVDGADALKESLMARNEAHGLFKIADDPRITRVGRWLRRTNLDELPQLINVLRGEMSLVGPRPLVLAEDARVLGADRRRLHLKPGMTGPWQTLGQRVSLGEMVKVDYLYIANWSLWIDLKILIQTVPHVVSARGR